MFITAEGVVKVVDFSIAKVIPAGIQTTRRGYGVGTAPYMAPDNIKGGEPKARFDVYSPGILLWEMLAGYHPFHDAGRDTNEIIRRQAFVELGPLSLLLHLPEYLDALIRRATAKDPNARFFSMAEFAKEMQRVRDQLKEDAAAQRIVLSRPPPGEPTLRNPLAHRENRSARVPDPEPAPRMLVRRALPLVDELAKEEHARYRGLVELADLRSAGKLALYAAVVRFDDAFRVDFEQFARWRVYGAMVQAVRHEALHARVKRAARHTMARLLAYYTDDFNVMRDDDAELQRRLDKFCDNLAGVMFAGGIEEVTRRRPDVAYAERAEYARAIAMLQEVVADLGEPEERMLTLLFREELTLHEVADRLGISYQAAWCRNTRLLKRLRDELGRRGLMEAPAPTAARLPGPGPPGLRLIKNHRTKKDGE